MRTTLGVVEDDGSISLDYIGKIVPKTDEYGIFKGYVQVINGKPYVELLPEEVIRVNMPDAPKRKSR